MSKKNKLGKILAVTAIVGTATAAVITYLHKTGMLKSCKDSADDSLDIEDEFEFYDEDFDFPEDNQENATREYITINTTTDSTNPDDVSTPKQDLDTEENISE